jgi:hypothetical protein
MTRLTQRDAERHQVQLFFRRLFRSEDLGLEIESPEPPAPDVWACGGRLAEVAGASVDCIGIEVTEYHHPENRRAECSARWERLAGEIDEARRKNASLKGVSATIDFKDELLPKKNEHLELAKDLVRAAESAIQRIPQDGRIRVGFIPKTYLSQIPREVGDWTFLPEEDFPAAAKHLNLLHLGSGHYLEWPPWFCPRLLGAWTAPSDEVLTHILESKKQKAARYDTQGRPLWLLIIGEVLNDPESHVFPRSEEDVCYLHEQVVATGFDFSVAPFQQVWVLSEFKGDVVRLYPTGPLVP